MIDITSLLWDIITKKGINSITKATGIDPKITQKIAEVALPKILNQLGNNANSKTKSADLEAAISSSWDKKSINLDDGEKILSHIFKNPKTLITDIAKESKTTQKNTKATLGALAPMIMGILWENSLWKMDIAWVGKILKSASKNKLVIQFLDKDGDGDIKDDIFSMILNFVKKKIGK